MCYGREERKVTAGTTARRARYLSSSSWHSHLSSGRRSNEEGESWCGITTTACLLAHHHRRRPSFRDHRANVVGGRPGHQPGGGLADHLRRLLEIRLPRAFFHLAAAAAAAAALLTLKPSLESFSLSLSLSLSFFRDQGERRVARR